MRRGSQIWRSSTEKAPARKDRGFFMGCDWLVRQPLGNLLRYSVVVIPA